jgi:Xaa-Pro dipeptidase
LTDTFSDGPSQRRNFFYLSGCSLPDSYLTYNIEKDELTLYIPPIDPESVVWSGLPVSPTEALDMYDVDIVIPTNDVNATLAHYCLNKKGPTKVFAIPNQVSAETTFLPFDETNFSILKNALEESRTVKDAYEIALLRRANEISSSAHIAVSRLAQVASNERELEATFIASCMANGCRKQSYHPILASGTNAATLHYQKNSADLIDPATGERKLNLLIDAGGEYRTYCADITRVFPLSGKFSTESRQIYDIVVEMQMASFAMLKADVMWEDVQMCAHRVAIRGLLRLGILRGTEDELFEKRISIAFFPHGVGHYLGMDTHDVGGNPRYDDMDPMFRYLRIRGRVPPGGVVTVEPGVSQPLPFFIFLCVSIRTISTVQPCFTLVPNVAPTVHSLRRLSTKKKVLRFISAATLSNPTYLHPN